MPEILYIDAKNPLDIRVHYNNYWRIMTEDSYAHDVAQIRSESDISEQVVTNPGNQDQSLVILRRTCLFLAVGFAAALLLPASAQWLVLASTLIIFMIFRALTRRNKKN